MKKEENSPVVVIFCTVPPGTAHSIAGKLVEKALVACVNIFPVQSVYRWDESVCNEPEELLIMKTTRACMHELSSFLVSIHPYEIPEVLCIPVVDGFEKYLSWVTGEVSRITP